ncbi:hypothetical protein [Desulfomicrobium norvegicum]|uniref:hypothetical protein n=1 Tax=Desulfomicrobium norvegicum (strain DSM 1741 / NCIMB 8310) TaxID=52561 RepID=UPI000B86B8A9|nr:hypothetical protein [Desulfomicrobium norvegicum]
MKYNIKKHFALAAPSTSTISGVKLTFPGDILKLQFDYDKDGIIYKSTIQFDKVRAHRHEAEIYCPAWKIESSYDTLVEILNSTWASDLKSNAPDDLKNSWKLNHYMIYFESDGCFEVISDSWSIAPEMEGCLE